MTPKKDGACAGILAFKSETRGMDIACQRQFFTDAVQYFSKTQQGIPKLMWGAEDCRAAHATWSVTLSKSWRSLMHELVQSKADEQTMLWNKMRTLSVTLKANKQYVDKATRLQKKAFAALEEASAVRDQVKKETNERLTKVQLFRNMTHGNMTLAAEGEFLKEQSMSMLLEAQELHQKLLAVQARETLKKGDVEAAEREVKVELAAQAIAVTRTVSQKPTKPKLDAEPELIVKEREAKNELEAKAREGMNKKDMLQYESGLASPDQALMPVPLRMRERLEKAMIEARQQQGEEQRKHVAWRTALNDRCDEYDKHAEFPSHL